jgi:hypothetical protein
MATTMAQTESTGGPPLSSNTPPSTANPSRQTSVKQVNNATNESPFNGGGDDRLSSSNAAIAVVAAAAVPPQTAARDVRANSFAEPPPPPSSGSQQQRSSSSTATTAVSSTQPTPSTTTTTTNNETISYSAERIIGNGSFGVVFQASVVESGEIVAIKKVLQDKRFKNRELQIMRQLVKDGHSNIVALKHCFYSQVSLYIYIYFGVHACLSDDFGVWWSV